METEISHAVQDYAKAIYSLSRRAEETVSTSALADRLGVSAASASAMAKRLAELGLVTHEPYRGVRLTDAGETLALEVIRHHRLLELYLSEALGMPWDRVHDEAEVLEHAISGELADLIAEKLGEPTHDPHGDPIPTRDGRIDEAATRALADSEPRAVRRQHRGFHKTGVYGPFYDTRRVRSSTARYVRGKSSLRALSDYGDEREREEQSRRVHRQPGTGEDRVHALVIGSSGRGSSDQRFAGRLSE